MPFLSSPRGHGGSLRQESQLAKDVSLPSSPPHLEDSLFSPGQEGRASAARQALASNLVPRPGYGALFPKVRPKLGVVVG